MSSHRLSFYDTNKGVCNLRTKNKMELTLILILKKQNTNRSVYYLMERATPSGRKGVALF